MRIAISALFGAGVALAVGSLVAVAPAALAQPTGDAKPADPKKADAPKKADGSGPSGSTALTPGKTPPPPSTPGTSATAQPNAPSTPPQTFNDETGGSWKPGSGGDSNAGWNGMFFLRDSGSHFIFSPTAMLQLDFNGFAGAGVNGKSVSVKDGAGMPPRFALRRFRLGVQGAFLEKWSYLAQVDFGPSTDNADGGAEIFAAAPGQEPTAATARYRAVQGAGVDVNLADVWINYSFCLCLNLQAGQFRPPISMEQRTADWALPFMDRNMPIRSFVVPANRETGFMVWGQWFDVAGLPKAHALNYEFALLGGDGQNRPEVDTSVDVAGRVVVHPLATVKPLAGLTLGVSGRHGDRDPDGVGYNYSPITSSFGWVLYNPSYTDAEKRKVKVIPSGGQNEIGGELRLPIGPLDLRSEVYFVANHTREAIDGFQFTNTERLGTLKGVGWYGSATLWLGGDKFISGDPGVVNQFSARSTFDKGNAEIKRGAELSLLAGGINGDYDGNSRGGNDDAATPGSVKNPATNFNIYQFSAAASYWHSKWARMSFNYSMYLTPGSGSTDNLASVPGNVYGEKDPSEHLLHEFGLRLQVWN